MDSCVAVDRRSHLPSCDRLSSTQEPGEKKPSTISQEGLLLSLLFFPNRDKGCGDKCRPLMRNRMEARILRRDTAFVWRREKVEEQKMGTGSGACKGEMAEGCE